MSGRIMHTGCCALAFNQCLSLSVETLVCSVVKVRSADRCDHIYLIYHLKEDRMYSVTCRARRRLDKADGAIAKAQEDRARRPSEMEEGQKRLELLRTDVAAETLGANPVAGQLNPPGELAHLKVQVESDLRCSEQFEARTGRDQARRGFSFARSRAP